jgi:ribonuclease VapC
VIVIDTSAIVAIVRGEGDAAQLAACVVGSSSVVTSAATVLEAAIVLNDKRFGVPSTGDQLLDEFLGREKITIEPVTLDHLQIARLAHRLYGKGTGHAAALNFGDCFAYALAKALNAPLLYKGVDFAKTDIVSALA